LRRANRWSPRSYELRDFLARNHVPYQWIDVELSGNDPDTKRLLEALGPEAANLPVVLFPDGTKLLESVPADVAQKVGLRTRAQTSFYDLAIVGGGPAGLAAAVYGASEGLHTVMVEREAPGGQAGMSSRIENYLGFPTGLSGGDLARRAVVQARRFGVEILAPQDSVLHYPNTITARDFDGWVQERGLYFMDKWDEHFTPLLSCHDPNEDAQKGGLLRAQYGKGTYIYTGYAFFRQLPAGVPGAVRLYVNLLSAGHEKQ